MQATPLPSSPSFHLLQKTTQTLAPRKPSYVSCAQGVSHRSSPPSDPVHPTVCPPQGPPIRGLGTPRWPRRNLTHPLLPQHRQTLCHHGVHGGHHTLHVHLQTLSYSKCTKGGGYLKNTIEDPWVKTGITFCFLFYVISDCHLSREEGEAAGRFVAFHSLPYWTLHPPAWLGLSKFCLHSANMHARPSVCQALCAGGRGYEDR